MPGFPLGNTRNRTLQIVERICQRILELENDTATAGVVAGFEPMNEAACYDVTGPMPGGYAPGPWPLPPRPTRLPSIEALKAYYYDSYALVRRYLPAERYMCAPENALVPVPALDIRRFVIEHAFNFDPWVSFMPGPLYQNVVLDLHLYQAFSYASTVRASPTLPAHTPARLQVRPLLRRLLHPHWDLLLRSAWLRSTDDVADVRRRVVRISQAGPASAG